MKHVARIAEDINGYHVGDEALDYIDCQGTPYPTKASALRAAADAGYTHAIGSGTYWVGVQRIPTTYRTA